ncbi:MAG: FkbM family methyltransferase, partial [Parvibaculum sp.]|uniref:FkbM family methyltransferase n=1 Tax=Parvibaculum sp. TaxID=2024848 RepID=UPI003C789049
MSKLSRSIQKRFLKLRGKGPGWFLRGLKGVIHVGANTGQERHQYAEHALDVLWVEPIESVFAELVANIAPLPRQTAVRALLTDKSGEKITLNIANNNGASSSILQLKQHKDIWPHIHYVEKVEMVGETLPDLLARSGHSVHNYDGIILDTQGSELMILRGAASLLSRFRVIQAEVADFESYEGCCTVSEMDTFLRDAGFFEAHRV